MMKKLGLATALLLAMTGAQAYQFEVQGQSEYIDATLNDKDFTGSVAGTYYYKNVDSSKGPLAEAAFLNQASNISLAYTYGNLDLGADRTLSLDTEAHTYGVKGEAYIPTPVIPLYTSAAYSHTKTDTDISEFGTKLGSIENNGDRYALELGALLAPNFLVAVGYANIADPFALDANNIMSNGILKTVGEAATAGFTNQRLSQDIVTARTKYVGPVDGTNASVGFEAAMMHADSNNAYQLKTDVYFTPKFSVGASYAESNFTDVMDSAWGANINYFITPAVAVGASYVNANAVGIDADTQTVGVNAKFRF
ncbi:porin Omp33-36 [Acinetobacter radioresistens]|uniref:porin Omp33-36 n=2 Tax=Acinetobacter radioresistens TaxID=40216 RepID=UPI0022410363|nr:porin Omp33-36 [Acinetobacter radioresistens]MCX0326998.1 porin Omp33-36 [Acinetobacter radioresistens]